MLMYQSDLYDLSDLMRDLDLLKLSAQLLGSIFMKGTTYKHRQYNLLHSFQWRNHKYTTKTLKNQLTKWERSKIQQSENIFSKILKTVLLNNVRCCKPSTRTCIFQSNQKITKTNCINNFQNLLSNLKSKNYWFLKQIISISNYFNSFFVFNISLKFHITLKF